MGIKDSEIFYSKSYDIEADYQAALDADPEHADFGLTLYDNLYQGYSPEGKNTLNIITLQGYSPWVKFEADYFQGNKDAYRKEKVRMAEILIQRVEETLLPERSTAGIRHWIMSCPDAFPTKLR